MSLVEKIQSISADYQDPIVSQFRHNILISFNFSTADNNPFHDDCGVFDIQESNACSKAK